MVALAVSLLSCRPSPPSAVTTSLRKAGPLPEGKETLFISKSTRRLSLLVEGKEVFTARAALGRSSLGPKEREGDRRTPEGDYYVCTRNDKSRYRRFLGLSYPNLRDAEAGFRAGRITRAQRDAIADAVRGRRRPPWDTPLGGEVGIHGSGAGRDWTLGCVAVEDPDIDVLWKACPLGTPVRIVP
jgi:murein L,D-transpeptidase YafK